MQYNYDMRPVGGVKGMISRFEKIWARQDIMVTEQAGLGCLKTRINKITAENEPITSSPEKAQANMQWPGTSPPCGKASGQPSPCTKQSSALTWPPAPVTDILGASALEVPPVQYDKPRGASAHT